jgi:hypothetical protein
VEWREGEGIRRGEEGEGRKEGREREGRKGGKKEGREGMKEGERQ